MAGVAPESQGSSQEETFSESEGMGLSGELLEAISLASQVLDEEELNQLTEVNEELLLAYDLATIARGQKSREYHPFFQEHERLRAAFEFITPVAIGVGARLGTREVASAAGIVGGPVLAGLAGGAAKFSTAYYEARRSPARLYERYIERQAERASIWGGIKAVTEFGERAAIESSFGVKEREEAIVQSLSAVGIVIEDDGRIVVPELKPLSEVLRASQDREQLIEVLAVQGRLANFYSRRGENVKKAYAEIFLTACATLEREEDLLKVSLAAARAEVESKALGVATKLAALESVKSGARALAGYALAEAVMEMGLGRFISEQAEKIKALKESISSERAELENVKASLVNKETVLNEAKSAKEAAVSNLEFAEKHLSDLDNLKAGAAQTEVALKEARLEEARIISEMRSIQETVPRTVTDTQPVEIATLKVEIPEGSTLGHAVAQQFEKEGIDFSIWGNKAAPVWEDLVLRNEGEFFKQAHDIAEKMGGKGVVWLSGAEELGFDYRTGTFDKRLVAGLVERAEAGDKEALKKLHELFHWVRAGKKISLPENMKAIIEGARIKEIVEREIVPSASTKLEELKNQLSAARSKIQDLEGQKSNFLEGREKIEAMLGERFGPSAVELVALGNEVDRLSVAFNEALGSYHDSQLSVTRLEESLRQLGETLKDLEKIVGEIKAAPVTDLRALAASASLAYGYHAAYPWLGEAYYRHKSLKSPVPSARPRAAEVYEEAVTKELTDYLEPQRDELRTYLPDLAAISEACRQNRIQELVPLGPGESIEYNPQTDSFELTREIAGMKIPERYTRDGLLERLIYEKIYHTKASAQTILLYKGLTLEERQKVQQRYDEASSEVGGLKYQLYWRYVDHGAGIAAVPSPEIGRLYFNPNIEYTADVFRLLNEAIVAYNSRAGTPISCQMKILNGFDLTRQSEQDPFRPDKIVLYFQAVNQGEIYNILQPFYEEAEKLSHDLRLRGIKLRGEVFRENLGLFAGQVLRGDGSPLRGVGFAQEPSMTYQSYGEIVSSVLARMVKDGVDFTDEAVALQRLEGYLLSLGVDPQRPYLFLRRGGVPSGREIFNEFDQHISFRWY